MRVRERRSARWSRKTTAGPLRGPASYGPDFVGGSTGAQPAAYGASALSVSVGSFGDPRSLPGLVWWSRSDLGITLNGGKVSAWADQSGAGVLSGVSQATAAAQPTYSANGGVNGLPVLQNAANGVYLANAANLVAVGTARTVFTATKASGIRGGTLVTFTANPGTGGAGSGWIASNLWIPSTQYIYTGPTNDTIPAIALTGVMGVQTHSLQAGSVAGFRFNGAAQVVSGGVAVAENAANPGFHLMGRPDQPGQSWIGDFYESIVYSRILTASEITQVEHYLGVRYAIAGL